MRKVVTLNSLETPEEQGKKLEEALKGGFEVEATIKTSATESIDPMDLRPLPPKTIAVAHVVLSDKNEPDDFDI
jgi:hypothetical protein